MITRPELFQFLAQSIEEITFGRVPATAVRPQDRIIADLGLDSLDYATVMLQCEQRCGVKLDENRINWSEIDTIEKLAALFVSGSS